MKRRNGGSKLLTGDLLKQAKNVADRVESGTPSKSNSAGATRSISFSDLDEYQEIKKMEMVSEALKLANPFFRVHDERAGATTTIDGQTNINFSSYDYLGLNSDSRVAEAATAAIRQYGVSTSASRLVAGERQIHQDLECKLAALHGVEAAICFVSGHATNVAAISTLVRDKDLILFDEFSHNSITTGAKLSGAKRLSFPHNDLSALEKLLKLHRGNYKRAMIVVEGLYSMDGDMPDLKELVRIKNQYGAWLMVDEAHSIGTVGKTGRGLSEEQQVEPNDIDVWMGTLSKTFASTGGYIAGSKALIEILRSKAGGFIYSVGLSPPLAGAALQSVEILNSEPERVAKLQENGKLFCELAKKAGLDIGLSEGYCVVPIQIGNSLKATKLSENLLGRGINVLPIIFPAVSMNAARLRFFITCDHTREQIEQTVSAVAEELSELEGVDFGEALVRQLGF